MSLRNVGVMALFGVLTNGIVAYAGKASELARAEPEAFHQRREAAARTLARFEEAQSSEDNTSNQNNEATDN